MKTQAVINIVGLFPLKAFTKGIPVTKH